MTMIAPPEIPAILRVARSPGALVLAEKRKILGALCTEVAKLYRDKGQTAIPLNVGCTSTEEVCWEICSITTPARTVFCYLTADGHLVMKGDKCPHGGGSRPPHYLQVGEVAGTLLDRLIARLKAIGGESSSTSS